MNNVNPFQTPKSSTNEHLPRDHSMAGYVIAIAPMLVMLCLYYSLAAHMYYSLGRWPETLGQRGFPNALINHDRLSSMFFMWLAMGFLASPFAIPICAVIPRTRFAVKYLITYVLSFAACVGLMICAPSGFTAWWFD